MYRKSIISRSLWILWTPDKSGKWRVLVLNPFRLSFDFPDCVIGQHYASKKNCVRLKCNMVQWWIDFIYPFPFHCSTLIVYKHSKSGILNYKFLLCINTFLYVEVIQELLTTRQQWIIACMCYRISSAYTAIKV